MIVLWKTDNKPPRTDTPAEPLSLIMIGSLLAGLAGLTLFAGPLAYYTGATAAQLNNPQAYIEAVLNQQEGTR